MVKCELSSGVSPGISRLLAIALWTAAAITLGMHLALHVAATRLEMPMGSWETVYAAIARVWPAQYQWENFVVGHDGYGPGYPTFMRPFLALGGDVYLTHRIANLGTLIAIVALLARLLRSVGCPRVSVAALLAIFYALNAGSYSIQARPDFLVLLEIVGLLALGEAVARGRVAQTLLIDVALGLLALLGFFTKAYSLAAWGATIGYFLFFRDWRKALRAAFVGGVILAAGIAVFATLNPLYKLQVYHGQIAQANPSASWLGYQTGHFLLLAGGVLLVGLTGLRFVRRPEAPIEPARPACSAGYWRWHAAMAVLVLVAGPGWHTGAYLTYFFHLLLVPMLMLAGHAIHSARGALVPLQTFALVANLMVLAVLAPAWPHADDGWKEVRVDVLAEPGRVAVDYLLEPLVRERPSLHLISTGASGYTVKEPFLFRHTSPTIERARQAATAFLESEKRILFGSTPADTLYLDCLVLPEAGGRRFPIVPRNELPHFLGAEMNAYMPVHIFTVRPYYFATNAPRETAGTIETAIVKFVRKPQ